MKKNIKNMNDFDYISTVTIFEIIKKRRMSYLALLPSFHIKQRNQTDIYIEWYSIHEYYHKIDLIGFFSPRKLNSFFGIKSKKPLIIFQFYTNHEKNKIESVKNSKTFGIKNNHEFFILNLENFKKLYKTCNLQVDEPPKVIFNL